MKAVPDTSAVGARAQRAASLLGGLLLTAFLLPTGPAGLSAQERGIEKAVEARHRADCRLAHQVLTTGEPARKTDWAISKASSCRELGGEAIATALFDRSGAGTRTRELERLVIATDLLIDERILQAALEIAQDPSAGEVARVQAIRIAHFQVDAFIRLASYDEYVRAGETVRGVFHTPVSGKPTAGKPLPSDATESTLSVLRAIRADPSTPDVVRRAAENVRVTLRPGG